MRRLASAFAVLVFAGNLLAQTITLPAELKVTTGRSTPLLVTSTGKSTTYDVLGDADVFREFDPDTSKIRLRVTLYSGDAWLVVASADDKGNVSVAKCHVISSAPPTPPGPGPNPPTPGPGPFDKAPFGERGAGFHALIVFESADAGKLSTEQHNIIYGQAVRSWLNAHTQKEADGTLGYSIFDKDADVSGYGPMWQKVMARPRKSLPWLVCQGPRGWYEGPLPATVDETIKTFQKCAAATARKAG